MTASDLLKTEFSRRKERNPSLSLRAFARWLQISPAQLSQVISGKRPLTQKMAASLSKRLGHSPKERIEFLAAASPEISEEIAAKSEKSRLLLEEDRFSVIANWYHFAILSLTKIPDAKADPRWIARRLGITTEEANEAVGRLRRLGILSAAPAFKQISAPIRVMPEVPSAAVRKYHQQNLSLAASRLDQVPMASREFQSVTLAADPKNLERFRKRLDEFLDDASEELAKGSPRAVFTLAVQLFPVTPIEEKK